MTRVFVPLTLASIAGLLVLSVIATGSASLASPANVRLTNECSRDLKPLSLAATEVSSLLLDFVMIGVRLLFDDMVHERIACRAGTDQLPPTAGVTCRM